MSQSARRAAGSRPVVGSSRKTSSGSLTSARATDEPLPLAAGQVLRPGVAPLAELEQVDQLAPSGARAGRSSRKRSMTSVTVSFG